jgi:hypothetical protein
MDSTFPQGLLDLKRREDLWRPSVGSFLRPSQPSFAKPLLETSHTILSNLSNCCIQCCEGQLSVIMVAQPSSDNFYRQKRLGYQKSAEFVSVEVLMPIPYLED